MLTSDGHLALLMLSRELRNARSRHRRDKDDSRAFARANTMASIKFHLGKLRVYVNRLEKLEIKKPVDRRDRRSGVNRNLTGTYGK